MEYKLEEYPIYEEYIDKRTKEKVVVFEGEELIKICLRRGRGFLTLAGKYIRFTQESQKVLMTERCYSPDHIEIEIGGEVVCKEDMVVYFSNGTIDIFAHDIFTEYFEKEFTENDIKISKRGILRVAEKTYLNLNNCSSIIIDEDTITLKSGRLLSIERKEVEHFDKIKGLIKNYVEE